MGVHIGTFRDLYVEILENNGIFTPVVTPALDNRLVQETVDAALTANQLVHYGNIAHKPGFILVLQDAFAELRGAYVTPEALLDYTRTSSPTRFARPIGPPPISSSWPAISTCPTAATTRC